MTDLRTDADLIAAINGGSAEAFDVLYLRYRDHVARLAYRFTGDREAALDVTQETFLYVLRKFPGLELTARFSTFVFPVVRHIAIAHNQKRRRQRPIDNLPEELTPPAEPEPRDELGAVMAGLSEEHRQTLLLRFVDGLSLDEIAATMEVPIGTVKSRIHHALKMLREDPRTKIYFET